MTKDTPSEKIDRDQPGRPPTLVPPDATASEDQKPSRGPLMIVIGGLFLIIAALLVVFLPMMFEKRSTAQQAGPQPTHTLETQPPSQNRIVSSQNTTDAEAQDIEQLIKVWLQKQAEAEAVNISAWGGDRYLEVVSLAKECDKSLREEQYLVARAACDEAIAGLGELLASKEHLLDEALAAGLQALEQGKAEPAAEHFQQALSIDADNERAAAGARRAEQLPAVLQLLQDGSAMENGGDQKGALSAFTKAAAIDPEFVPAQQALNRVKTALAEQEFQQAMSSALQAAAEGRFAAARASLQKAETISPGNRAVLDLKQQLLQNQQTSRLSTLRQEAERLEQKELWPEALKICTEALSLEPHAAFAVSCKERVSVRIDLDNRLRTVFAKPERLFEEGPRKEARQILLQATQLNPRGPLLAAQIDRLDELITEAEAEIKVVILSDGLTDVVVYHVGRLGTFLEKSLILRTGDYTATGSRDGFRDVRKTLKVRPGSGKMIFTLRCEEPI